MSAPSKTPKARQNRMVTTTARAAAATTHTPHQLSSKALRLVKRSRKNARKLRKLALKQEDRVLVAYAENMVEIFDAMIDNHKVAKDEAKTRERLGIAKK